MMSFMAGGMALMVSGSDMLYGGAGSDVYVYNASFNSF